MLNKIKCLYPFTYLEITKNGVYSCCSSWTNYGPLGDLRNDSLISIWNNVKLQNLRKRVYDNNLAGICSVKNCPFMLSGSMINLDTLDREKYSVTDELLDDILNKRTVLSQGPTRITLSDSGACNLKCIMCGSGYNYKDEDKDLPVRSLAELRNILPDLREIRLTGDGDPFFRKGTREFLQNFDPKEYPKVKFIILSNGQMLDEKMWNSIKHNNISQVWISVDAATKKTYEKIRVGGNWERLLANLAMISRLRKNNEIQFFEINMTIMRSNYQELVDFIKLGDELKCDSIALQRFYGNRPQRENIFDPPDPYVIMQINETLQDPIFKKVNTWTEGISDIQRYAPSLFDKIKYEMHYCKNVMSKYYNKYIGWRLTNC